MPKLNDIAHGIDIGKKRGYDYIFLACVRCGKPRWVKVCLTKQPDFTNLCRDGCQQERIANNKHSKQPYWNGTSELQVGMMRSARELSEEYHREYGNATLVFDECPKCHRRFWRDRKSIGKYCRNCLDNNRVEFAKRGENAPRWNGGRMIRNGYIWLTIQPDNPYYAMAKGGRVQEHRLVMAQHLGRCLESWEIVHHKGVRFPQDSEENKQDNLIDNLEVMNQIQHLSHNRLSGMYHKLQKQFQELQGKVTSLEAENASLIRIVERI